MESKGLRSSSALALICQASFLRPRRTRGRDGIEHPVTFSLSKEDSRPTDTPGHGLAEERSVNVGIMSQISPGQSPPFSLGVSVGSGSYQPGQCPQLHSGGLVGHSRDLPCPALTFQGEIISAVHAAHFRVTAKFLS